MNGMQTVAQRAVADTGGGSHSPSPSLPFPERTLFPCDAVSLHLLSDGLVAEMSDKALFLVLFAVVLGASGNEVTHLYWAWTWFDYAVLLLPSLMLFAGWLLKREDA
jgi:hypothetical protein